MCSLLMFTICVVMFAEHMDRISGILLMELCTKGDAELGN